MKLDVYINSEMVGALEQAEINRYIFTYSPDARPDQAISLIMPVRTESWISYGLHPVFQTSLPEGALRLYLERKYSKAFTSFGDIELLSVIGSHLIGRLRLAPHGSPLSDDTKSESIETLLRAGSTNLLEHFLASRAEFSGVSGAFPKFLAKSPTSTSSVSDRTTFVFDKWLVKGNNDSNPDLVLNEYFGLRLSEAVGLNTPEYMLSDDAQRLLIRRFDFNKEGLSLGLEDMCSLFGFPSSQKFTGSVERIINTINSLCPPGIASQARHEFYRQYLTCMAMRNGDAHLKNFALIYDDISAPRLSPAYDMVTMSAYAPKDKRGDALDMPALSFGGSHRWFSEKSVKELAARCLINLTEQNKVAEALIGGFRATGHELRQYATQERPQAAPIAKRLLELWSHGIAVHSNDVSSELKVLADSIDMHGFDDVYIPQERQRF